MPPPSKTQKMRTPTRERRKREREGEAVQATLHVATFVMGPTRPGEGETEGGEAGRSRQRVSPPATDTDRPRDRPTGAKVGET